MRPSVTHAVAYYRSAEATALYRAGDAQAALAGLGVAEQAVRVVPTQPTQQYAVSWAHCGQPGALHVDVAQQLAAALARLGRNEVAAAGRADGAAD